MSSKTMTERADRPTGNWQARREMAPSLVRPEEPTVARWVGSLGLVLVAVGAGILLWANFSSSGGNPLSGLVALGAGILCLLFHASVDRDVQIRRSYGVLGLLWLLAAILAASIPFKDLPLQARFLTYSVPSLILALMFLLPFARHEAESEWRAWISLGLGGVGAALALTSLIGSNVSADFLLPYGLVLGVLGLAWWWASVGVLGISDDRAYWSGVGMGVFGAVMFIIALARSIIPPLSYALGWMAERPTDSYLATAGLPLLFLGTLYMAISAGLVSDNVLVTLTRRELAAFFYSPIAYIVLFSFTIVGAVQYGIFFDQVYESSTPFSRTQPLVEPIIQSYIFSLLPVFCMLLIVPVVTMRLLSEEKRTGTLEVLLTAPVDDNTVVLSKFFASLIFYLALWVPWGLFLIGLRVGIGQPFDYRPLISFFIALVASGSGFLSMGLFFSALTRNQIAAAILSAMGMVVMLAVYLLKYIFTPDSLWWNLFKYVSFVDFWATTLLGRLVVYEVVFYLSLAVFWLFLTVKVLEARKWK
ncbi:MAG: ABC transporter permease [Gemmataceae bacterium]|nr:ABC transporter permease [Gemmataceae bacterium]MDW8265296.1 ABC transporter permease [Gemmataceae bacterium]